MRDESDIEKALRINKVDEVNTTLPKREKLYPKTNKVASQLWRPQLVTEWTQVVEIMFEGNALTGLLGPGRTRAPWVPMIVLQGHNGPHKASHARPQGPIESHGFCVPWSQAICGRNQTVQSRVAISHQKVSACINQAVREDDASCVTECLN